MKGHCPSWKICLRPFQCDGIHQDRVLERDLIREQSQQKCEACHNSDSKTGCKCRTFNENKYIQSNGTGQKHRSKQVYQGKTDTKEE